MAEVWFSGMVIIDQHMGTSGEVHGKSHIYIALHPISQNWGFPVLLLKRFQCILSDWQSGPVSSFQGRLCPFRGDCVLSWGDCVLSGEIVSFPGEIVSFSGEIVSFQGRLCPFSGDCALSGEIVSFSGEIVSFQWRLCPAKGVCVLLGSDCRLLPFSMRVCVSCVCV